MASATPTATADHAEMFELAPVSLWLEDYTGVRALFDQWRAQGVTDLRAHLRADRERVAACTAAIRVVQVNRRTLELFEAQTTAQLVSNLPQVFRDDMFDQHVEELAQLWAGSKGFASQSVNYTLSGRRLDILVRATVLPGHEQAWDRVLVSIEDVTERTHAQRALQAAERYARGLFEHSPVSLWVEDFTEVRRLIEEVREAGVTDFRTFTDVHPEFVQRCMHEIRVIDVNRQTLLMFGARDRAELLDRLPDVFRDDMEKHFREQLIDLWAGKIFQQREVVNYGLDGQAIHVYMQFSVLPGHEADWSLVLVSLTDITARKKAEAYLEFLGKHDPLTKLRNRSFFSDEMARLERRGLFPVTVVMLDLNGLKHANDQHGHVAGDGLLRRAGEVLAKAVDKGVCAARIGGDEFALLLPSSDEAGGEAAMARVQELAALNNQFYGGLELSFSMGMATCRGADRLEATLHLADKRMYAQKKAYYHSQANDRRRD